MIILLVKKNTLEFNFKVQTELRPLTATSIRPELTMETTPKAKESGTSLIIIIVIVIFFVVLCVLFYLMKAGYLKCCKQPEPRAEDPEAGKPLVDKTNSSDKSNPSQASEQQSNQTDNAQGTTGKLKSSFYLLIF